MRRSPLARCLLVVVCLLWMGLAAACPAETLVLESAEPVGICGIHPMWNPPVVTGPDGVRKAVAPGITDRGGHQASQDARNRQEASK